MLAIQAESPPRIIFLDNLRYLFVLCVVLQHACNAYNGMGWWPVQDQASLAVRYISALLDAFTMPLLFYLAGYFALPSMVKSGPVGFIKGKLKRLGIPWLVCILTICPILPLIYHYTRDDSTLTNSYGQIWLEVMKNGLEFNVGLIPSMDGLMIHNQFYQRYMWFLSMLLAFFFLFSMAYVLKKSWFQAAGRQEATAGAAVWPTLKMLLAVGGLTSIMSFGIIGLMMATGPKGMGPEPLFTLGNVIQFRPSRLPLHLVYFSLGVLTYRNKWIERGKFPGHWKTWAVSFVGLAVALFAVQYSLLRDPKSQAMIYGPLYHLILNFLTISTLSFLASLAIRLWNRPSGFDRSMASHSYNIYLGHYLIVIVLQLLLLAFPGLPSCLKFSLISLTAIVLSYLASRLLIKPYPKATVAGLFGLLLAMILIIRP